MRRQTQGGHSRRPQLAGSLPAQGQREESIPGRGNLGQRPVCCALTDEEQEVREDEESERGGQL